MSDPAEFEIIEEEEAPKPRGRIAGAIFGILAVVMGVAFARGTLADAAPRDPASSSEGTVTQLLKSAEGLRLVRCAKVIDRPSADVWAAVTDYDHFTETFPYLTKSKGEKQADGIYLFTGTVHTPIGDFAYDTRVKHEPGEKSSRTWWDESGRAPFKVNRGSWTVMPLAADRTLLVYSLELKVEHYPSFLVNNLLLARLPLAIAAVDAKLAKK